MEQAKAQPVGTDVTSKDDQIEPTTGLPTWLSVPDPPPIKPSKGARELLHTQYAIMFENFIEQVYRGRSLRSLVEDDPRLVSYEDFLRWIKRDPQRHERFKEAQEARTEFLAGEILEIADGDGLEDVQRSKLRIDSRQFLIKTWNRKRYGDVKTLEVNQSISINAALEMANNRLVGRVIDHEDIE